MILFPFYGPFSTRRCSCLWGFEVKKLVACVWLLYLNVKIQNLLGFTVAEITDILFEYFIISLTISQWNIWSSDLSVSDTEPGCSIVFILSVWCDGVQFSLDHFLVAKMCVSKISKGCWEKLPIFINLLNFFTVYIMSTFHSSNKCSSKFSICLYKVPKVATPHFKLYTETTKPLCHPLLCSFNGLSIVCCKIITVSI